VNRKHLMIFGLAGAAVTTICCFTPILVGLLGLVGLGAVTGYLDYVLLPALAGFIGLYGLLRRNRNYISSCCTGNSAKELDELRGSGSNDVRGTKRDEVGTRKLI